MKHKLLLSLCLLHITALPLTSVLIAQDTIPGIKSVKGTGKAVADHDATRFNLDFPGGTARELIEALSRESGTPVNAYIPEAADQFRMPPIKYYNISVAEVLSSLSYAESVPVLTAKSGSSVPSIEYRVIGYSWTSANNIWTMNVDALTPGIAIPVDFKVKPFSIEKLLDIYTIDAITTTIDSAWKLNNATEENEIMFHPETKLLLVKCPDDDMIVMQEVLNTLYETLPEPEKMPENIRVSVLGQVNKPGNYLLPNGATLTDVIAEAGGATRLGNQKAVTVKNPDKADEERFIQINLGEILTGNGRDIEIQNGTTVSVPERIF